MREKTKKIQQYKIEAVNQIKQMVKNSQDIIFTNYQGLDVQQITELRRQLREREAEYRVIKNSFTEIALSDMGLPFEKDFLIDPTALTLIKTDLGPVAKVLFDFARNTLLQVKGGMIDGKVLATPEIEALSKLPGREQLYAVLMGTMTAPLINLFYAMNGGIIKLLRTIQAVADARARADNKVDPPLGML